MKCRGSHLHIRKSKKMRRMHKSIFFPKIALKIRIFFFKLDGFWNRKARAIVRHAFPARGSKIGRVSCFLRETKKIQKLRDFRDISKIFGTNVSQSDTYPEENNRDFQKVIFGVKKFFAKNRVFFDFCKKNQTKNSYFWKWRVLFETEKWAGFFDVKSVKIKLKLRPEKFVYGKREKNRYSGNFRLIFFRNFRRRCLIM